MERSFPTLFQEVIHQLMYARFNWDLGRRETWEETVDRYFLYFKQFLKDNNNYQIPDKTYNRLRKAVLDLDVIPSMRASGCAERSRWRMNS